MNNAGRGFLLEPTNESWTTFVKSHPQANIFHLPDWSNLLAECYGYRPFVFAVQDQAGEIQAGLPLIDVRSWLTGRRWVCLPFTDYCAPLCGENGSLDQLSEELVRLFQQSGPPRIEVRWELPTQPLVQAQSHFVVHTIELDAEAEEILRRFHRTQRQNIRTAEKNGIEIIRGEKLEHLRAFYYLHCLTRRRHGIPVQPWRFFQLILNAILEKGLGFILLAYHQERCIAAGLFLHWNQTLTYKYSASDDESQGLRPNHLITWTAIRWGCEHGFKCFDFGRTDITDDGLRTFKNRWGAEETPLTYSVVSSRVAASSSSRIMTAMQRVIQNAPVWACRVAGELLYKHFG